MPNRNYERGARLEREVINIFKKHGYEATRTAGSHSPFDVIIWKKSEKLKKIMFVAFVQCKTTKNLNLNPEALLKEYQEDPHQQDSERGL